MIRKARQLDRCCTTFICCYLFASRGLTSSAHGWFLAQPHTIKKQQQQQKGNFVRLNLRNRVGLCLGARNVRAKSKAKLQWEQRKRDQQELYKAVHGADEKGVNQLFVVSGAIFTAAGVDLVDDFVDGRVFTVNNAANGDMLTPSSLSIKSALLRVQKS
jgi:hypothetical protein